LPLVFFFWGGLTMSKHTKSPWRVAEKARWQADVRFVRTSDDGSGVIGCCGDDDAEFIVCACNAHDELLEACREAIRTIEADQERMVKAGVFEVEDGDCQAATLIQLHAAIAKAEG
jgi:hypothetical protein